MHILSTKYKHKNRKEVGIVTKHFCNSSTKKTKAGGS